MGRKGVPSHKGSMDGSYSNSHIYSDGSMKRSGSTVLANNKKLPRLRWQERIERNIHQRKRDAAECNLKNPVKPEDRWICAFCEYEAIFGKPPSLLIRSFEIKDIVQKQDELDRKRLRDKVKAKSRKGRKMTKAPAKGSQPTRRLSGEADGATAPPLDGDTHYSTQSDSDSLVAYDGYQYDEGPYSDPEGHRREEALGDPGPPPPRAISTG